jgi:hypothetical protein
VSTRGSLAKALRESKAAFPDQFCAAPKCLWRIKSGERVLGPCRNHPTANPGIAPSAADVQATYEEAMGRS